MRIFSFLIGFFVAYSTCAANLQTEDFSKTFKIGKQNYVVKLSEERWNHIVQGDQQGGGHSYEHFNTKNARHVIFDTLLNTYIVSPVEGKNLKKGDNLSSIISNIQNRETVQLHTLFPAGVLNKSFVVDALIDAFTASKTKQTKELGKGVEKSFFYANNHHGFHVAGFFTQKTMTKNKKKTVVLHLQTIFPDLEWFYRIRFLHQKTESLPLSRFLLLKQKNQVWRRYGANLAADKDENEKIYWPSPIENIASMQGKEATLSAADYAVHLRAKEVLEEQFAKSSELDVLNFFFDNAAAPTEGEFNDLLKILARHVPEFKLFLNTQQKSSPVLRKFNLLKLRFKDQSSSLEMKRFFNLGQCEGFYDTEELGPLSFFHFGEELVRQMLGANTIVVSGIQPKTEDELFVARLGSKFARNLLSSMIGDGDLLDQVIKSGFIFEIENFKIGKSSCEYRLSLFSTQGITHEAIKNQEQTHIPILKMKGVPLDHLKVEFFRL